MGQANEFDITLSQGGGFDSCFDKPDERNIKYRDLAGNTDSIPKEYYIDDGELQDQNKEGYPYGCVFFSQSQGQNIMNFIEGSKVRSTGKELCDYAEGLKMFNPSAGALIINGPKVGVLLGYLDGYADCDELYDIKHSIANNRPVQCGSNKIIWSSANKENGWTVKGGDAYGHSIILTGYSDKTKQFRIKQSYQKRDNGFQYLNYSDFGLLFPSKFSLIDKKDPLITNYKKQIMDNITLDPAKDAFTNGFWSGTNPKNPASREEVATMIQRVYEKLLKDLQN